MNRKIIICILTLLFLTFPSISIPLVLDIMGAVSLSYHGFAVDSENRVYVGMDEGICIFCYDTLQEKIDPQTSRGYFFTIENDTILVSTGSTIYEMDLQGTLLRSHDDTNSSFYNHLQDQELFLSAKGDEYALRHRLWRYEIVKNGKDVVYQMPLKDFLSKLSLLTGGSSLCLILPVIITQMKKTW